MASVTQEQPPGKRATKTPVIFDADEQEAQREAELAAVHAEAMARLKAETLKVPWTLAGIGRAAMMINKRVEKLEQQEDERL
ncbi:hypothetical protein ABVK25_002239 [Lepraria finkii]|uniref:Uncharacterized protein n=1 Tax=Lepraria finkii TaxID=1340010 RepID=A0ABR4BJM1_9LECA